MTLSCAAVKEKPMYDENESTLEYATCPACGGDGGYLGTLGNLDWFRCIYCGAEFKKEHAHA